MAEKVKIEEIMTRYKGILKSSLFTKKQIMDFSIGYFKAHLEELEDEVIRLKNKK